MNHSTITDTDQETLSTKASSQDALMEAFDFRFACKQFDPEKRITDEQITYILEAGRLSPSSFGLEPWHFVVISDPDIKRAMHSACYQQPQITSCSHLIFVLYRSAEQFTRHSPYLQQAMQRMETADTTAHAIELAITSIDHYFSQQLPTNYSVDRWAELQTYIAATNMMTAAAYHKIDSCAIGGFNNDKVMEILESASPFLHRSQFSVGICLALGYRHQAQTPRIRWPLDQIVTNL